MTLSQKKLDKIQSMIRSIDEIIKAAENLESEYKNQLKIVHPKYRKSAVNLIHYLAFREKDSSDLQKNLGNMGLSRLAKNQDHVMASLQTTHSILQGFLGETIHDFRRKLSVKKSRRIQKSNAKALLGYRSKGRRTRIMVTLPSDAANDYHLVEKMLVNGMNCARINCAHDNVEAWAKMIQNVRTASKKLKKRCKVAMDLGGPKIRTGQLVPGLKVLKIRPLKDERGKITQPLKIWISPFANPNSEIQHIPVCQQHFEKIINGASLFFKDARKKKREIVITKVEQKGCFGLVYKTTYLETGIRMYFQTKKEGDFIEIGELPRIEIPVLLNIGDILRIDRQTILGESARTDENGKLVSEAHIFCTAPEIIDQVRVGEPILFDDGKIEGRIKEVQKEEIIVEIVHTASKGGKLRSDKGINLPSSELMISGLTEKDKKDLEFVTQNADVVNMSFVNNVADVQDLLKELKKNNAKEGFGVILKIETQSGFNNLFEILLEAMQVHPVGVMIARGDLAIEVGWTNIGRVQGEILSICESAHITDVWATQVLENLAKNGIPSRAEITDVIKAQQADCVMLNKGPYILDSIKFLDMILKQMEPFREKSTPFSPKISKADPNFN
jgi:pyruvate kinase